MRRCRARPLPGNAGGDLIQEVAGIESVFGCGLNEANDSFRIGGDEQREVSRGKPDERFGRNDERGCAAEQIGRILLNRSFGFGGGLCGGFGFKRGARGSGHGGRRLREEAVEMDAALADAEEGGENLLGHANALGAPVGE